MSESTRKKPFTSRVRRGLVEMMGRLSEGGAPMAGESDDVKALRDMDAAFAWISNRCRAEVEQGEAESAS